MHEGRWIIGAVRNRYTLATCVPELDLAVTVAVNQNQEKGALNRLALEAIKVVAEARR